MIKLLITLAAVPFIIVWNAYVLTYLWAWFAIPVFHIPRVTVAQAAGLSMLASYLFHRRSCNEDDSIKKLISDIVYALVFPAITLGFAFLVNQFV